MPRITVEIEWDAPDDPLWLNADNIAIALHAYCTNTRFKVRQPAPTAPDRSIGAQLFDSMVKNLREFRQMVLKSRGR